MREKINERKSKNNRKTNYSLFFSTDTMIHLFYYLILRKICDHGF